MTDFERKKIDIELRSFVAKNLERPSFCKNLEQVRFYVRELALKIEACKKEHGYVPAFAYTLLAQYNSTQNRKLDREFKSSYC